ncbi:hypothetical protein U0070_023536, partial [Myodes glareolus]
MRILGYPQKPGYKKPNKVKGKEEAAQTYILRQELSLNLELTAWLGCRRGASGIRPSPLSPAFP